MNISTRVNGTYIFMRQATRQKRIKDVRLVTEILDDDISCVDKVLVNKPNSLFHLFFLKIRFSQVNQNIFSLMDNVPKVNKLKVLTPITSLEGVKIVKSFKIKQTQLNLVNLNIES